MSWDAHCATPEEAAHAVVAHRSPRFVGVAVRGDVAVVGHWVRGQRGEGDTETTTCHRDENGWEVGDSGNGSGTRIFTAEDRVTAVSWGPAPDGAVAGRFGADGREQLVPVEDGFFFLVFDDLPYAEPTRDEQLPDDGSWTGYVRKTDSTPEERRAWMTARSGFEFPELIEWVFAESATEA